MRFRATNIDNIRESVHFKAKDLNEAKTYVIGNLDPKKSWALFIVEDE